MASSVTRTTPTATGVSSQILAFNGHRTHARIENRSDFDVYLNWGSAAVAASASRIGPRQTANILIEHRDDAFLKGACYAITNGPIVSLAVMEVA